jgi:hypothetical protein
VLQQPVCAEPEHQPGGAGAGGGGVQGGQGQATRLQAAGGHQETGQRLYTRAVDHVLKMTKGWQASINIAGKSSARIYRPSFHQNKPKTLIFNK